MCGCVCNVINRERVDTMYRGVDACVCVGGVVWSDMYVPCSVMVFSLSPFRRLIGSHSGGGNGSLRVHQVTRCS